MYTEAFKKDTMSCDAVIVSGSAFQVISSPALLIFPLHHPNCCLSFAATADLTVTQSAAVAESTDWTALLHVETAMGCNVPMLLPCAQRSMKGKTRGVGAL